MDDVLSKRDWATDGLKAYIYRVSNEPAKLGRPGYLARFERPFDQEDVRKLPGFLEGAYTCIVKQGSDRIYSSPPFDVFGPPTPYPGSAASFGTDGGAGTLAQLVKPLVDQAAGGVDIKSAVTNVLDMQNTAFKSTLASINDARAAAPDNSLERAAELFVKLGLIRAPGPDVEGGGADSFSRMVDTFDKLGLLAKRRSLADEINDVLSLTERLGLGGAGRRGGGGSDWAALARELGPKLLETGSKVVSDLRRIAELRATVGAGIVAPGPVRSNGNATQKIQVPAAGSAAAQPSSTEVGFPMAPGGLDAEAGASAAAPPSATPAASAGAEPVMTAWDWLRHGARRCISNGGGPGDLLGFLDAVAPELVDSMAAMTIEQLSAFIESDEILSTAEFRGPGGRLSFLTLFHSMLIEPGEAEPGEGEEEDGAEGAAVPVGGGGLQ